MPGRQAMEKHKQNRQCEEFHPAISHEEYNRILSEIELRDMRLERLETWQDVDTPPGAGLRVQIESEEEKLGGEGLSVSVTYRLKALRGRRQAIRIWVTYRLDFTATEAVTDDFFEVFRRTSLPGIVWPFVREVTQTISARMGLPPLTLPLLKAP